MLVAQGGVTDPPLDALAYHGQTLVDMDSVTLTIKDPSGSVLAGFPVVLPPIVRVSVGHYVYPWAVDAHAALGSYSVIWAGRYLGVTIYGYDTVEVVDPGAIHIGGAWLPDPEGLDAVRALLGVTTLGLTDDMIMADPFEPHAELKLKIDIPNWATATADQRDRLRLATEYGTAALIAETYAKGGMPGLTVPGGGARDWPALATLLWTYYEQFRLQAMESQEFTSTLRFVTDPLDFAAIRQILGQPELSKAEIESLPFGAEAERRLILNIPDWASVPVFPNGVNTTVAVAAHHGDQSLTVANGLLARQWAVLRLGVAPYQYRTVTTVAGNVVGLDQPLTADLVLGSGVVQTTQTADYRTRLLKLAAEYATAALIASKTLPNPNTPAPGAIRPGATAGPAAVGLGSLLWDYYQQILAELSSEEEPIYEDFDAVAMIVAGPSRRRDRRDDDIEFWTQDGRRHMLPLWTNLM
jgi:hypothetical protein